MFTAFFILLFIGVNTGNLLLYFFFSKTLVSEIHKSNLDMLTKIKNATELMHEEIISLSARLSHSNITITKIMFESERDRLLEYQGWQILQSALISYPSLGYFTIYNERLDIFIGTMFFTPSSEARLKDLAKNYYRRGIYRLSVPLAVERETILSKNSRLDTITLPIYSPLSLENDKGVLLVGIKCDYFQQLIKKLDQDNLGTVLILHENNRVISHPDIGRLLEDFSDNELVREINSGTAASGFFLRDIDDVETFVSYTRSNTLGWTFINTIPYKAITSKLLLLRNLTFIITFLILCVGMGISHVMAMRLYRPIQKQLDYLNSTVQMSEPVIRTTVAFDLLKNQYIDNDIINSQVIEKIFKEPYYLVCVFSYDKQEAFEKLSGEQQGNMRNRLIEIAEELMKNICSSIDHAVVSSTDIALLLHLDTGAIPEQFGSLMAETGEMVKKFNGLTISAAAGSVVNSIFAINDSFEEALDNLKERFFLGHETTIILKSDIGKMETQFTKLVREAVELAARKYSDPLFSINTAAEIFNKTPAYFNRIFKKYKQISYSEFLNRYRMEKACTMILETNESFNTIAASVGITNTTYFYTLFKKIYNCTPQQFRNAHPPTMP
jgi:AraC-like DNA-binding protein